MSGVIASALSKIFVISSLSDVPVRFSSPELSQSLTSSALTGSVTAENTTGISLEYAAAAVAQGVVIATMISSPSALNLSKI